MKRFLLLFALAAAMLVGVSRASPTIASTPVSTSDQLFLAEAAAQAHCPRDTVVWLNTASGINHEKGMRWYGRTRHGAYVCRAEANAAGDRDTRNGQ